MKLLVVGSGGREHALVWKLFASPRADLVFCAPGNAGTPTLAKTVPVDALDLPELRDAALTNKVDLTIVGPEAPLAAGIVDYFAEQDLKVFGPSKAAAQIEASKIWAKGLLQRHGIPTARAEVVEDEASARAAIKRMGLPCVIKADGLAGGKGVAVLLTSEEADHAVDALFVQREYGEAGARALVEECLTGRELSVLAFTDGETIVPMPAARDYKRLGDHDSGPNTGGMGGYTRPSDATADLLARVEREILRPTVAGMAAEGTPFRGVLYAGLMLTPDGPRVLEFNCRFGDPEAELILPLLESDLAEICQATVEGQLKPDLVRWGGGVTCGVVLAARGYPHEPEVGATISGLDDLQPGVLAFHGATRVRENRGLFGNATRSTVSAGGRVLTVVATGPTLEAARVLLYENIGAIDFPGKTYRTDIGREQNSGAIPPSKHADLESATPGAGIAAAAEPLNAGGDGTAPEVLPSGGPPRGVPRIAIVAARPAEVSATAEATLILDQLGIAYTSSTISVANQPAEAPRMAEGLVECGTRAILAVAGSEPALAGLLAVWTGLPVVALPLADDARTAQEQMLTVAQSWEDAGVAIVSPGQSGARAAAWLLASILGAANPALRTRALAARQRAQEAGA